MPALGIWSGYPKMNPAAVAGRATAYGTPLGALSPVDRFSVSGIPPVRTVVLPHPPSVGFAAAVGEHSAGAAVPTGISACRIGLEVAGSDVGAVQACARSIAIAARNARVTTVLQPVADSGSAIRRAVVSYAYRMRGSRTA